MLRFFLLSRTLGLYRFFIHTLSDQHLALSFLTISLSAVLIIFHSHIDTWDRHILYTEIRKDVLTAHATFLCLYLVVDRLASVGAMVWIGLNHLKDGRGWQWSDGAPLSLVNFTTGTDYLSTRGPSESALAFVFVKQKMLFVVVFTFKRLLPKSHQWKSWFFCNLQM